MKLRAAETCLLVVDIQNDGCGVNRGRPVEMYKDILEAAKATQQLVAQMRKRGVQVIFTKHIENPDLVANNTTVLFEHKKHLGFDAYQPNSPGVELYQLEPQPDEPVFTKSTWSAFGSQELTDYLAEKGFKNLVICGVETEACVFSTVSTAYEKGYTVIVPQDCVATKAHKMKSIHQPIMKIINLYYGFVLSQAKLLKMLTD